MTGTLDPHYDFALLGTSLPLSILSAALSRAGYSVLHIDENDHYGGPWSSLTLLELLEWSRDTSLHQSQGKGDISISFPAFERNLEKQEGPPPELATLNRHFSISLAPTIVPCAGPTIDVLIRSKVASYCTFRLLQKTSIYSVANLDKEVWPLRKVPSSKEDIFKDKSLSLVDKRRLMKLLQQAVPVQQTLEGGSAASTSAPMGGTFIDYLLSQQGANLSLELSDSIAYGVALCSSEQDTTVVAMERIRRHITGIGRYGNAAYLVGQYGGAGEMAQCFCRASAVQGGTFVLGHKLESCSREQTKDSQTFELSLSLQGIEGATKVDHLVGDQDVLVKVLPVEMQKKTTKSGSLASVSGILLLDRGIPFEDPKIRGNNDTTTLPPETGLVIFPPREQDKVGAISALQMAEGTFSCPKGMYLIYLSASAKEGNKGKIDARKELKAATDEILRLASMSKKEWQSEGAAADDKNLSPLMECYYSSTEDKIIETERGAQIWSAQSCTSNVATSLDEATLQAENLFWDIMGTEKRNAAEQARKRRKSMGYSVGMGLGGVVDGMQSEVACDFFPPEDRGVDDDDY